MVSNGEREVQLVVRAKIEAGKALAAFSSALVDLTKTQKEVQTGAEKTGGTLTELGAVLRKLNQQVGGASTIDKLAGSMERAAGSVTKLEGSLASLTTGQSELAAEIQVTESALAKLTGRAAQLKSTFDAQSAAATEAKADLAALNAEVKSGESSLGKSVRESGRYETQLQKLETRLATTRQKHRDLTQELLKAEEPSKRLVATFQATDAALAKQTSALAAARAGYAANATATQGIEASLARLRVAQAEASTASEKVRASQAATAVSMKSVAQEVRKTEKALNGLKTTSAANAVALERQDKALAEARQELVGVETAAKQADVALEKIGSTVRQRLLRTLADAKKELAEYRLEWQRATAAVGVAVAKGDTTANPSPALKASLEVARASKAAYQELQIALQQMRTAAREAGTDVTKLAAAQQTFVAAMDRVRAKSAQVTAAQQQQSAAHTQVAAAAGVAESATRRTNAALGAMEGRGRQALTWAQRLRSEVIALATAYVGLYAAIEQLRGVTRTFMDIEAASARLGVAFNGNAAVVAREFRFLQDEADRLGIDIKVLAAEYSKLAIATKDSALEGEPTRKIFVSMSEAFRVAKLSSAQMNLAFNAVNQIVNKQAVSMEELRQQLGEKLPGAMRLAAKAMGLTGKEFNKLVATGNLSSDEFLPKFAEALDDTFGAQLPEALRSLSSEFGRFGNEITKAQLKVAKAGFIEGLRDGLRSLTKFFQSDEGEKFFKNLGEAAGFLVRVVAAIPRYIDAIILPFSVLIGLKVLGFVQGLGDRFSKLQAVMKPLPAAISQTTAATAGLTATTGGFGAAATVAGAAVTRMGASLVTFGAGLRAAVAGMTLARAGAIALTGTVNALRGALALLGGIPGLIVTGLSIAFTSWLGSTNDVINATEEHQRQMNTLLDTYSLAKDKAGDWAKGVQGVSLAGAEQTLNDLRDKLTSQLVPLAQEIAGKLGGTISLGRGILGDTGKEIAQLTEDLVEGRISVTAYADALDEIYKSTPDEKIREVIRAADDLLRNAKDSEKALGAQAVVVRELGGNVGELQPLIDALGLSMATLAEEAGYAGEQMGEKLVDPAEVFAEKLEELRGKVPSLVDELKLLEDVKEIDEILKTAAATKGLEETTEAYRKLLAVANQAKAELQAAFEEKQAKEDAKANRDANRRAETIADYHERLKDQLALKHEDAEIGKQATLQEQINLAIAKEAVNAKRAGTALTAAEKQQIADITTILYERKAAEEAITAEKKRQEEAEQRINLLSQARRDILQQMETARDSGNTSALTTLEAELTTVDAQLTSLIDKQIAFWEASLGGADSEKATAAIANLKTLKNAMADVGNQGILTTKNVGQMFGQQLLTGANHFLDKIRETGDVFGSLKDAFRDFASDFLLQLAKMILQQAIFNALQSAGGGFSNFFGAAAGAVGQAHTGGIAGYGLQMRQAAPSWFTNATRYHSGGIAGLKPNEVPAVLLKGEEVLTEDDPRHVNNGGASGEMSVKVVNTIDSGSFVSEGMQTSVGQKAILNFIRANSGAVNGALGRR